jgi:hypothetical protein
MSHIGDSSCLSARDVTVSASHATYAKAKDGCRTCSAIAPIAMAPAGCAQRTESTGRSEPRSIGRSIACPPRPRRVGLPGPHARRGRGGAERRRLDQMRLNSAMPRCAGPGLGSSIVTDWAASLIPVGTLALGSVLTMVGQARSDRRVSRRERDSRRDDFRIRRYEIERDTLLALQDALIKQVEVAIKILNQIYSGKKDVDLIDYRLDQIKIGMLTSRCLDRNAADAANKFCDQVESHVQSVRSGKETSPGWGPQLTIASDLLSAALRRDPFE